MPARKRPQQAAAADKPAAAELHAPPATRLDMPVVSAASEGIDSEGNPTGLLMWGQAGVYNAVDDRYLIAALSGSDKGVVRPARLIAGGIGLTVNIQAGWLAVASCEDGTQCVVGSRQMQYVQVAAGPATGTRTDYLWCDVNPDAGTWTLRVISQAQTIGRNGVSLARIDVPAGANLSTHLQFSQMVPTLRPRSDGTWRDTNFTPVELTPRYPIAPHQIQAHRAWKLTAYGAGNLGVSLTNPLFDARSGWEGSGWVNFDIAGAARDTGDFSPRNELAWWAECIMQINPGKDLVRLTCRATLSNATRTGYRWENQKTGVRQASLQRLWQADWYYLCLVGGFQQNAAGQAMVCTGSTFEMYEPLQ